MPPDLSRYYNRFDRSKNYDELMFHSGRNLQAPELNEIQSMFANRVRSITDVLFKDGDLVRDAGILVDAQTGVTTCQSGAVYVAGAVRGVPTGTLTIPVNAVVTVGLYVVTTVVTEKEDNSLYDPSTGARNVGNPGAYRRKVDCVWGFAGDGQQGEFFPIYTVENGVPLAKEPPPNLDAVTQTLARYDRDSAGGSYVVAGLNVAKQADVNGDQVYTVAEGRARVNGFGIEMPTSRRLIYPATPDLLRVDNEPHSSASAVSHRVNLNRTPVASVAQVTITRQKIATLVHGGFNGAQDPLPDTSIVQIIAVNQGGAANAGNTAFTGGTTYLAGTDYKLTADKVDWSLGGDEVAAGSTYQVIYQCIENVVPDSVDATGLTVIGAVAGTTIFVDYDQKLPRIDRLCLDAEGAFVWLKGVAASYSPLPPVVPGTLLALATVGQTWDNSRTVINDGVRVVPMSEIAGLHARMDALAGMVAQQTLRTDATNRDTALKKGMFVDPFLNDSLRDQGVAQSAAVVNGVLTLPISGAALALGTDVTDGTSLAFTLEPVLSQTMRTGTMKVNPYMAYEPLPAAVKLTPAVDQWTEVVTNWASPITTRFVQGSGNTSSVSSTTFTQTLSDTTSEIQNLRQIEVKFELSGFGPNEALQTVKFDGITVVPTPV